MRKVQLVNGEYYHVYNRGVEKRPVFLDKKDISRFLQSMSEFNRVESYGGIYVSSFHKNKSLRHSVSKWVNIVCFCLNPNHYHLILEQVSDKGIEKFMHKIGNGYTKYFNHRHKRNGVLFQGPFQSVHIKTNKQLLYASTYVNLNYKVHKMEDVGGIFLSSWSEYEKWRKTGFCEKSIICDQFPNFKEYEEFSKMSLEAILRRKGDVEFMEKSDEST
ncbi:MAG: transposase [Parcubacteria group bacterium]|jgi:REP element-mobilizing transposase RayT